MFNLEEKISAWRKQMLAAGIKTPVPLEELESHLRDEIERQTKSGLSEAAAFEAGVQKIGQGHILQKEFNKVTTSQRIRRAILLIIGWLAAGCALLYSMLCLDINWNFFSFSPRWDSAVPGQIVGIVGALAAFWFLAKVSRDRTSRAGSLLICLLLTGIAVLYFFHVERGILAGQREIPIRYRGGLTLLLCLPGVFRVWWGRRHIAEERDSTQGSRPIQSN